MKNKIEMIQQGDVLLRRVAALPADCKKLKTKTVAEGEATGHHHTLDLEHPDVCLMSAPDGRVFVVNGGEADAVLTHQEHKPVAIPPGVFEFGQVREKDWFQDMVRAVRD